MLAALRQQIAAVATAERLHVDQQVALHRRFLELQTQSIQALETRRASRPMPTADPAPTVPRAEAPLTETLPSSVTLRPPAPVEPTPTPSPSPSGPTFERAQLEIHSSGRISDIFGTRFEVQDGFRRQVRMPEPPLLLADRITGLDAEPGSLGVGTIWSETDVTSDAWYLHQGQMPGGIMIEAGQADLMLISYLGVDFSNRNDRVYRLLGCELTYHGGLPRPGDTLRYDIHMDGHATQGDVRLMFFHYDCRIDGELRLSVRQGQAGFFTDDELAHSEGCLWTPEEAKLVSSPRLDPPTIPCDKTSFSLDDVVDFSEGRPWDCFGPGFERTRTHTRTPRIQDGRMMLIGPVTDFDPRGGPWGRGYVRSTVAVQPDTWFFDGHFKNDPCMPGTLMFEASLQLMAFYMTALGYTVSRDGWRFEPVSEMPFELRCRGQVTPSSERLVYELFVEEVQAGPTPTLVADLLCTVDGLKAFHARRLALRLVPDWPMDGDSPSLAEESEPKEVAREGDFFFDHRSLLACANGRPSEAFGPAYSRFDGPTSVARLPSPPYHFISRVTRTTGAFGSMATGTEVEVEYDVPPDAWYFDENGCRIMPFAILLEAALQPCGWLASYLGCALSTDTELRFRNLDGQGTLHADVLPDAGTLRTRVRCTAISKTASMIIVSFDVESSQGDSRVFDLTTVFGFFPQSALDHQVGLPPDAAQRTIFEAPASEVVDLSHRSRWERTTDGARLAEPMLLMLDRVTHFDPTGGTAGLGCARGVKQVDPGEWFFKAHFFQDPVQPGSLGLEAMIQLLQWTLKEMRLDEGIDAPRFEALGLGEPLTWKYRGQVVPENDQIVTTMEITETRDEPDGRWATADASLWVDGKRIYEARNLSMRIVSGGAPPAPPRTLDPTKDTWLEDHRPTWTVPALPMMSMADLLAQGASSAEPVTAILDMRVVEWLTFPRPRQLRVLRSGEQVRLVHVEAEGSEREIAAARILTGPYGRRPDPWPTLEGEMAPLPYIDGELFHGPAFQLLESLVRTSLGASSVLRASTEVPPGRLNPGLLDAATHGIPHDQLHRWDARLSPDRVAYPTYIPEMRFFGPTPLDGEIRCEIRPDGYLSSIDFPAFRGQLIGDQGVWCQFRLVEACFDKGTVGSAPPRDRRAFLRDRVFVSGVRTSTQLDGTTRLTQGELARINWMPGTVKAIYGTGDLAEVAVREHIAAAHALHPGRLPACLPLQRFDLEVERRGESVSVRGDGRGSLDLKPVADFWTRWFRRPPWIGEDLYYGLIERFVDRVILEDPTAFAETRGKSLVYLANHQVGIESLLFTILSSGLSQVPTITLAKAEHRSSWLGELIAHCFSYPGIEDPQLIRFFERTDASSLPAIAEELVRDMANHGRSVMVHVEGTRSLDCKTPVRQMSGAFIDLAMAAAAPVVPVRFVGGLPRERLERRIEFPVGMGRQDIYIGRPIAPEALAELPYGARRRRVLDAINTLGPSSESEQPRAGDAEFVARVAAWQSKRGVSEAHAVLGCVLAERRHPTEETRSFLAGETSTASNGDDVGRWLAELARRLLGAPKTG